MWDYEPQEELLEYLTDMQDAIKYAIQVAFRDALKDKKNRIPSPIILRREIRDWFYSRYTYARHHINPVCRAAVAILRSSRKKHSKLRIPEVKKLAVRIDGELFRLISNHLRITLQPNHYAWLPVNASNKHYDEYSHGKPSELLITGSKVCLTFVVGDEKKPIGKKLIASDLNFGTIDSTRAKVDEGISSSRLESVKTESIRNVARIQNDISRRRRALQKHIRNPQKRAKKLRECRGRQRNRIKDALHKLSTQQVRDNSDVSFVFEDLKNIRKRSAEARGRKFRAYLNMWPYRMYQSFVEYKSPMRTLYVSPRGTSSECPVCGGKLEHPAWAVSRCNKCGVDYDRNRLASLAILCRGLRLCGQPFAVSADASWKALRDEYLHARSTPGAVGAGWTEPSSAPNGSVVYAQIPTPGNG